MLRGGTRHGEWQTCRPEVLSRLGPPRRTALRLGLPHPLTRECHATSIGRWQVRSFSADDDESLALYANNPNVALYLRDTFPAPYTLPDAEE